MARYRMLPPAVFEDEVLAAKPADTFKLLLGLWGIADREGRLEDRPVRIRAKVFPYQPTIDVDAMLNDLAADGYVLRYSVGGARYLWIPAFLDHQKPHIREAASTIPPYENTDLGNAEHLPRHNLGSAEHLPRRPESESESVIKSESVSIPESLIESETGTGTGGARRDRAQHPRAAKKQSDRLSIARAALQHHATPQTEEDELIDIVQYQGTVNGVEIRRTEAIDLIRTCLSEGLSGARRQVRS